ncbi:MAG: hypothetical protein L6R42_009504 [Xanthoria sp. 1 TBL-2021]|nr:MAG: hypothetical protein L6R42_009504 [Xanthoria sp. 1 TBL-2021]
MDYTELLLLSVPDPRPDVLSEEMILQFDQLFDNNYFGNERLIDDQTPFDSQTPIHKRPSFGYNMPFEDNLPVPSQQDPNTPVQTYPGELRLQTQSSKISVSTHNSVKLPN